MEIEIVSPNIRNFVKSLRDVGYTFEIAVADVLDNSISANSTEIKIYTLNYIGFPFIKITTNESLSKKLAP